MARHVTTHVMVERLASQSGHWCARCALPSGWRFWFVVRLADQMHLQDRAWCDECDRGDAVVLSEG